jgi:hypothetical protein
MPKPTPGPSVKIDSPLPCGCTVGYPEDPNGLEMDFCPAHESAFEILDGLHAVHTTLQNILEHVSSSRYDLALAMDAAMKARAVIHRASRTFWSESDNDA